MIKKYIPLAALLLCVACGGTGQGDSKGDAGAQSRATPLSVRDNLIDTMLLSRTVFNKEITCNGRLRAVDKADLSFPNNEKLEQVLAYNGDMVEKGELLAVVDTQDALINLESSTNSYRKAQLDLADKLIAQGYGADTTSVPKDVLGNLKISSGYNNSVENYEAAKRRLEECYLYAPFAGRIANQDSKRFQTPEKGVFCTLIDDSYFDVEFNVLEAELGDIVKGLDIEVTTFIDEETVFPGEVTQINPVIDDNGQIKVRAKVRNRDGLLIEGMNVKLVIRRKMESAFVVPKDAVLSRDGYFVVFKYVEDKAVWTYVDIVMSNIDSHVISYSREKGSELNEKDTIIIKGNLNLSDGSNVKIRE